MAISNFQNVVTPTGYAHVHGRVKKGVSVSAIDKQRNKRPVFDVADFDIDLATAVVDGYYAAVLRGHITGLARLSVRPVGVLHATASSYLQRLFRTPECQ